MSETCVGLGLRVKEAVAEMKGAAVASVGFPAGIPSP